MKKIKNEKNEKMKNVYIFHFLINTKRHKKIVYGKENRRKRGIKKV